MLMLKEYLGGIGVLHDILEVAEPVPNLPVGTGRS